MLESLEGKRGVVRAKPPLPAISGLFGQPTVINNVMSFASVPIILARGAAFYRDYGMGRSRGTLPFQLAGNLKRPGLVEKAFGVTLRELLVDYGGGLRPAAGRCAPPRWAGRWAPTCPSPSFDVPLTTTQYIAIGAMVGHGGIVAFDERADMAKLARYGHGVLCRGVLRQMHPLPHRLHPRRGGHRPHHPWRGGAVATWRCSIRCATPC